MAQANCSESERGFRGGFCKTAKIETNVHEATAGRAKKSSLVQRLAIDSTAAGIAALIVAPAMTIIDKGITENAAGRASIFTSMRNSGILLSRRPGYFLTRPSFGAMVLLYASTYLTANYVDTYSSHRNDAEPSTTTASLGKFCAVSSVNMTLSLNKDRVFARAFGAVAARPLTRGSYAPWIVRDSLTIAAAFNLPPVLASGLPESIETFASRLLLAQLITPSGIQFISSPLHLLGLDVYNRRMQLPFRQRIAFIRQQWLSTSTARAGRVFVAFGLGGVVNTSLRVRLTEAKGR